MVTYVLGLVALAEWPSSQSKTSASGFALLWILDPRLVVHCSLWDTGDDDFDTSVQLSGLAQFSTTSRSQLSGIASDKGMAMPRGYCMTGFNCGTIGVLTDVLAVASLREKWAAKIQNLVAELHNMGLVWGDDVKPDNVLVDVNDHVVVTDLEAWCS
ncbi:hypothetical protein QQS21_009377 [Conoideocrella luteorostrata]|uniref:Protein kinase domain-containing protein n=1 Tax=Conoideocrella luteorostrata TaxID=1105319 RepID=A0AAJ0FQG6_9HYPO|nr:hypothetical protein QQS21_009377 [Conoideocrella luteorostrata]